jgi:thiamine biosynthesis lipoprotein ApbE
VTHEKELYMRNTIPWVVLVMLLSMFVACTAPTEQATAERATERREVPVLQNQVNALNKAKALSKDLQTAENARQRMGEAEIR